jgi:aryl-alcohol dehydrogenase (NADP+)
METLHDLVRSGKVRYIGASSMWAWQFSKLQYTAQLHGWTPFISMQPHYNLIYREEEREMLPLCEDSGVGVIPWSPLARGFLAGNRTMTGGETARSTSDAYAQELYYQDDDFAIVDRVSEVARARGVPNTQIALAWLLSKRAVTAPIIGATKMNHLDDAVAALELKLTSEEIKALESPYRPHEVKGHR